MRNSLFAIVIIPLLASCSSVPKSTTLSDIKGRTLYLEFNEVQVCTGVNGSWGKGIWKAERIRIPYKQSPSVHYTPISADTGELSYRHLGKEEGEQYSFKMQLEFTTPTSGFATGTGQDFEWLMRYKKVPFTVK